MNNALVKKQFIRRYGELSELRKFRKFVRLIAGMTQDGESIDGVAFVMENDDSVDTVNRLIEEARQILRKRKS